MIIEGYKDLHYSLEYQSALYEELSVPEPTQLRAMSLAKITRKQDHLKEKIKAYEIVAEDLMIDLSIEL